ncbi:MAG: UDP-N-acetyl-D-mannosamine dehydrogenase [Gammaproteobacteria bacterium]|nr:UDP-N-acetyl-D-mannosamine dehydrogenase [Gammaproteobacteria bacterium]
MTNAAHDFQRICVVGLGYVGLPTAAILATKGIDVVGVDVEVDRVEAVNAGAAYIAEPDLGAMVRESVERGRLHARQEVVGADAFVIAVPTPLGRNQEPDLRCLRHAAASVAQVLVPGNLVVLESTSPVGTTEAVCEWLAEARPELTFPHTTGEESDIRVAYSPERVLPGNILAELVNNDRVVGGVTPSCAWAASSLYRIFVQGTCSVTSARMAELVKLTENAYRDVNLAFANELSLVCDALGVDPWEVIEFANRHPRVDVLRPGPGVGGHCVAVDPWFLVNAVPDQTPLVQTARRINDGKPQWVVDRVLAACGGLANPTIACLGLAYKANVGDLRESPAVRIVERLESMIAGTVLVVDPYVPGLPEVLAHRRVELVDQDDALSVADVVVVLTDHREFLDIETDCLVGKRLIDTRGLWGTQASL